MNSSYHDILTDPERAAKKIGCLLLPGRVLGACGYETIGLLQQENYRLTLWNVAGNLAIGLVAVVIGKICGDFCFEV